jgi:hypothetical protein
MAKKMGAHLQNKGENFQHVSQHLFSIEVYLLINLSPVTIIKHALN